MEKTYLNKGPENEGQIFEAKLQNDIWMIIQEVMAQNDGKGP